MEDIQDKSQDESAMVFFALKCCWPFGTDVGIG
jgi:hypothetical protein